MLTTDLTDCTDEQKFAGPIIDSLDQFLIHGTYTIRVICVIRGISSSGSALNRIRPEAYTGYKPVGSGVT